MVPRMVDQDDGGCRAAHKTVSLNFIADPDAVRLALRRIDRSIADLGLDEIDRYTVELVLAEVLNNIVEHGYAGLDPGLVSIRLCLDRLGLVCDLTDHGHPFPDGRPPAPSRRGPDPAALPEGGFGWSLIHQLTQGVSYRREDGCNRLVFVVPLSNPALHISG